jgi:hypothetical protein
MKYGFLLLASTALLLSGCALHSKAWDDAFADCQAKAIEQSEFAGVPGDQLSGWLENYTNDCMEQKGVKP